ncbi:hypothetical protein [Kamptonema formosum]|uniref:hypothetical protein n=1 Tax=Kamptonema formosum TaxID=331992 RepID=UPI0003463F11|nr:hypothetical protein [Oscillatoria sp. PCC 10802]
MLENQTVEELTLETALQILERKNQPREHPVKAKTVSLTPLTPLTHEGRGGKNKEFSPHPKVGEGVG